MTTIREYLDQHELIPTNYDAVNDEQEIERIFQTRAGDEMVVFGMGMGQIVNPISGGGSIFQHGDIDQFLSLPNEQDWIEKEA